MLQRPTFAFGISCTAKNSCAIRLVIFRLFFLCATLRTSKQRNTEIVVDSIQRIQILLGPQPFWQTPFPHNYLDIDRRIAVEFIFCVGPSECFIFQPCSFLSLYPVSCLSKTVKPRTFHSFFQPWNFNVGFDISKPVVIRSINLF